MLKLVVGSGVEYRCCRHGRPVSICKVPGVFGAVVVWVGAVDRRNTTGAEGEKEAVQNYIL